MAFLETEPETDVAFYENLPATADHDGDSKSSSTSGQAPARSEHLSLRRQPLHEEFSDLVPEQTTTDAHVFSSNNYMQEDVLFEPGSSDPNLESHPPHSQRVTEVLNTDQELSSPRNSATVAPASVTLSVPVMSESHQGQEQVLMAAPNVPTMPSACSDITTDTKYISYVTSTDKAITSYPTLRNKSVQEEQTTAEHRPPQQETPS